VRENIRKTWPRYRKLRSISKKKATFFVPQRERSPSALTATRPLTMFMTLCFICTIWK